MPGNRRRLDLLLGRNLYVRVDRSLSTQQGHTDSKARSVTGPAIRISAAPRTLIVATLALAASIILWASPVGAHTAFESSTPSDGDVIEAPVDRITITFTGAATEAGDGFQVLTPSGVVISPEVIVSDDQREFTLILEEPLVDGVVGVRWSVRAGDAHPIEGSFSFTSTATAPTAVPAPAPTATSIPATTAPAPTATLTAPAETSPTPSPVPSAVPSPVPQPSIPEEPASDGADTASSPVDLDAFLAGDQDRGWGSTVGFVGRALTLPGALLAIGVSLLSVLWREHRALSVGRGILLGAAVAVALGVASEALGFVIDDMTDALRTQQAAAFALRIAGAVALGASAWPRRLSPAAVGALALTLSFVFDGHTVSKGNRALTALADIAHVGAASLWIGGVALLVFFARSEDEVDRSAVAPLAARFSVLAPAALAIVGLAGVALTVTILDSASDLWSTPWGRILLIKSGVVAVAIALGGYNHFRLVPSVRQGEPHATQRFGRVIRLELLVLAAVGVITAGLVAAAA